MSYFFVAAAAVTLIAGAAEGKAQREAGKANQQIAENNATLERQQGQDEAVLAARESQQATWRTRALIGQQRAQIAGAGLDEQLGTPFDILGESAMFGGAEQSANSQDAARKAWGFNAQALNFTNQGKQARWAGNVGGKTTILRSVGSAIGTFAGRSGGGGGGGNVGASGNNTGGWGAFTPNTGKYAGGYGSGWGG